MYSRDAKAQQVESMGDLLQRIDTLVDVVAKDGTSKEIAELLRAGGGKPLPQDMPRSDARADEILRMPRVRTLGGAVSGETLGFNTFTRLNTALRALTGDFHAFQRTVFNTVVYANRAHALAERVQSAASSTISQTVTGSGKQQYRPATDDEISEAMRAAAAKGMGGEAMLKLAADMAKKGVPIESQAATKATQIVQASRSAGKEAGTTTTGRTTTVAGGAAAPMDTATLVRMGAMVALAAAPLVIGRMVSGMTGRQIDQNRNLMMLNPELATSYATFGVSNLLTDMKRAKGISESMGRLMESRAKFNQTVEPFSTFGTNVMNRFLEIGTDVMTTVLKPASALLDAINRNSKAKTVIEEAAAFGMWGAIGGGLIGAVGGFMAGGPMGAVAGAAKGAMWGGGAGVLAGAAIGGVKVMTEDEVLNIKKKGFGGMISAFAEEVKRTPVCPPMKFVP